MIIVTVMYALKPESRFDLHYYTATHMPLVRARWTPCGMQQATVLKGLPGPDGAKPTYGYTALLRFGSPAELQDALAKHGREVMGDVPNFTDVQPIIQANEVVE